MLMVNDLILHTLNDESFYIRNLIMKTFGQLFFEINAILINCGLLKKKLNLSIFWIVKKFKNSY
jgi:hypothetical protein